CLDIQVERDDQLRHHPGCEGAAAQGRFPGSPQQDAAAGDEAPARAPGDLREGAWRRDRGRGPQEASWDAPLLRRHDHSPGERRRLGGLGDHIAAAGADRAEPGRRQTAQKAAVKSGGADSTESPTPTVRRGEALGPGLDRWDVAALLALTAVAFILRFFSPIMPDF